MRTSAKKTAVLALLFGATILLPVAPALSANPFMGAGTAANGKAAPEVSPVRAAGAGATLTEKQASLRDSLGNFFYALKNDGKRGTLLLIVGAAFLYGVLHALGPGHRKTVIFSLYLARKAPAWEPAGTGLLLALLHAGSAVALLLILRGVSGAVSGKADYITIWLEGFAYVLLAAVALFLVAGAVRDLARGHGKSEEGSMSLGTILVTGIYPCPGAILVMVLSLSLRMTGVGVLAVFAMSLGMSIPIVAAGYLAWFGRTGFFRALKQNERTVARVSSAVELAGFSILMVFALYMAAPFVASLVRLL
jgi:nickel/cobalt transporter (NicO) family protein